MIRSLFVSSHNATGQYDNSQDSKDKETAEVDLSSTKVLPGQQCDRSHSPVTHSHGDPRGTGPDKSNRILTKIEFERVGGAESS